MKKILPLFLALIFAAQLYAQQFNCNTETTDTNYINLLKQLYPVSKNYNDKNRAVREIAINMILIQYNDGTIISPQDAMQVVEDANVVFAAANMHFNLCNIAIAPYPYAQFPFEDFNYQIESQIAATHYLPGYLNIYYARNVQQNATLPNSPPSLNPPRIVTSQAGVVILAHEMGHFFSLIHTHVNNQYTPTFITDELVNGSNCATAGDFICDTPADPGLFAFRMAPAPACQYIDTVTTDINGDLYNPIVNNLMSALSHCTDSYTPEQFSRMAYIADHHRAYLKTGGMNFTVDSIPPQVCLTDTAIVLSSPNPGGVFSGNGVIGNTFNPSIAGPGNHVISYTMPANANTVETTDAFFFYIDTIFNTDMVWQTFQVEQSGSLTGFAFGVQSNTNQNVNYTLYTGSGTGGAIVEQGSIQINLNTSWDWIKATLNNLPVIAGNFYTMQFSFTDSVDIIGNRNNFYMPGQSNYVKDLDFISYIIPSASNCSNTYNVNILVTAPTTLYADHIFDNYCPSFPTSYPEFEPAGGVVAIDNIINNAIEPSNLNVGQHTVTYTFDNQLGCVSVLVDSFNIDEAANINLATNSVFCASDSGISINTTGSIGNLYLDGNLMSNNYLDIPNLNIGNHVLSYAIEGNSYDWSEIDQENFTTGSPGGFSINGTGQYWQSFTADKNGYLSEIKLAINSPANMSASYSIYLGEGIFSLPIYSANTNFGGQGFFYNSFEFPDSLIEMKQDSIYTFQVSFQGNVFTEVMGDYTNNYTRGKNNFSSGTNQSDYWFKTYVKPLGLTCLADSVFANFEIVPSLNVHLGQDTIITTGQSITLDAGNAGNSYLWSTGDTSQTIVVNGTATIWVQVTSSSGCTASDTISIDILTTSNYSLNENEIKVWPNPISNAFEVSANQGIESVELIDMLGQIVLIKTTSAQQKNMVLNTENLCAGIYTVHIKQTHKSSYIKVLKQ